MDKKLFIFLFTLIVLIGLFVPQKALAEGHCGAGYPECANDCTACWVNSDCSYDGCWEDTNCGNCYVPPPPPPPPPPSLCTPYKECKLDHRGSNFCCNNSPYNWTPNPKGNNVCNYDYWLYCNADGTACDQGPYPYTLNTISHLCGDTPACGICIAGQTQTETQYLYSCNSSVNGGGCPGIENYCSETINEQQRYRTCNADCGGWSAWSGWSTVRTYPQCSSRCSTSSDPSSACYSAPVHTHKYRCDASVCIHDDASGTTTDPNCGGVCSAPPPPPPSTRYRCSGSSCIVDSNGPYTTSNCDNQCFTSSNTSTYVDPSSGNLGQSFTLTATGTTSCSTCVVLNPGGGLSCGGFTNATCSGANPKDGNPCWWRRSCTASTVGNYTASFTSTGTGNCSDPPLSSCNSSRSYSVNAPCDTNYYNDKTHVCFFSGINPEGGSFLAQQDDVGIPSPAGSYTAVDHNYGSGQVDATGILDQVSGIWRGRVNFGAGNYIFHVTSDDGVTLDLEGYARIIDQWKDQGATTYDAPINNLPSGYRNIALRWYENSGGALIRLWWDFTPLVAPCTNTSPGNNQLTGCLWDGINFNTPDGNAPDGLLLSSPVPDTTYALNQNWGTGQPNSFVGADTFSSRWRGNFTFKAGTYTFQVGADDGVRLKVGGVEKIDIPAGTSWKFQGYTLYSAQVNFTAQTTTLVEVEYFEGDGGAIVTLAWSYTPPPPPLGPWIQTTGGDVHSNIRINTPGGP